MSKYFVLIIVFASSIILTGAVWKFASKGALLDTPNSRSSHTTPTPSGGGIAIYLSFMIGLVTLFQQGAIANNDFYALIGAGSIIALIGLLDDFFHLSFSWRLIGHFIVASAALNLLGGMPVIDIGPLLIRPGFLGNLLTVLCLVWFLNLFNFMDGIDGIACTEAISMTIIASVIILISGGSWSSLSLLWVCALACLGFLTWNWPPAKIFMGDVGSGFLGILLGMVAIKTTHEQFISLWSWLILAGVFSVDATVTLIIRILEGKKWYAAHRSHAYQNASRMLQSHKKVTLGTLFVNVIWLAPLAFLATLRSEWGIALLIVAFLPLIYLAIKLGSGTDTSF